MLLEEMTEGLQRLDQYLQENNLTLEEYVENHKREKKRRKWVELKIKTKNKKQW